MIYLFFQIISCNGYNLSSTIIIPLLIEIYHVKLILFLRICSLIPNTIFAIYFQKNEATFEKV